MANFITESASHQARKVSPRRNVKVASAPTIAQARAAKEMHDEINERARTSRDLSKMTKFDSAMSREEIIAKVMGKQMEEIDLP
ncbi:MAG: hypothetical protein V4724_11155 [Pseudomonadota bacterium]